MCVGCSTHVLIPCHAGLIFAHFPSQSPPGSGSLTEVHSSTSSEEGGREQTQSPEATDTSTQSQATGTSSYSELGDGQVMEILAKHLAVYCGNDREKNAESGVGHKMDLVLFKGAIEHAARLCRSMVSKIIIVVVRFDCMCALIYISNDTSCRLCLEHTPC